MGATYRSHRHRNAPPRQVETGYLLAPAAAYILTCPASRATAFVDTGPASALDRLLEALRLAGRDVGMNLIVTFEKKTATEYDRKPGMKWLSCTAK